MPNDFYAVYPRNFQTGLRDALIGAPAARPEVLAYMIGYRLGQKSPEAGRSWNRDLNTVTAQRALERAAQG